MKLSRQKMLLVESECGVTDLIFEFSEKLDRHNLQILTAVNTQAAIDVLKTQQLSLAIVDVQVGSENLIREIVDLLHPIPVIALIPECDAAQLVDVLRCGASDVFCISQLTQEEEAFTRSVGRLLTRAEHISTSHIYRESLEESLAELRKDQQAAQQVQKNLLPPELQQLSGITYSYNLTASLLLSGDFVDTVEVSPQLTLFYLADVSGHGASSALVTVLLKNITSRLHKAYQAGISETILSPIRILEKTNQELLATGIGKHLTIFMGMIDTSTHLLTYAVGGHHPMPVLDQLNSVTFLPGQGMPVGLFEDAVFEERQIQLAEQFNLTLFSDGVLEVLKAYGLDAKQEALLQLIREGRKMPAEIKADLMLDECISCPDDIAIMSVARG